VNKGTDGQRKPHDLAVARWIYTVRCPNRVVFIEDGCVTCMDFYGDLVGSYTGSRQMNAAGSRVHG